MWDCVCKLGCVTVHAYGCSYVHMCVAVCISGAVPVCTCVGLCAHAWGCVHMCGAVCICVGLWAHVWGCEHMCGAVCTCLWGCVHMRGAVCTCVGLCALVWGCVHMCGAMCTCVAVCMHVAVSVFACLCPCTPARQLWSASETRTFVTPRVNTKTFGERSFSYAGPSVWNNLPQTLRHSDSTSSFKAASRRTCLIIISKLFFHSPAHPLVSMLCVCVCGCG